MELFEMVGAALVGLYFVWVVIAALRSGSVRYRTRHHSRTEEPKTYWMTVAWFAALAVICLGLALQMRFGR